MTAPASPALDAFIAHLGEEGVCVQVLIRRAGDGFELRHAADRDFPPDALKLLRVEELRALAQSTESGAFRPLKCAPNLRRGWRTSAASAAELDGALNHLYPGAVPVFLVALLLGPRSGLLSGRLARGRNVEPA